MRTPKSAKLMIAGMVIIMACLLSSSLAVADEIENLAKGGDFENDGDIAQWSFEDSAAIMTIDKKEAAVGERSLFVEIDHVLPDMSWEPQVHQTGFTFEGGQTYTLSSWFKAEEQRQIRLCIGEAGDPWGTWLSKTVNVGTEWEEFWTTGVMPVEVPVGRITPARNNAGFSDVNYWMDDIKFYEGEYVATEIEVDKVAVFSRSTLATTWSKVKTQD